MGDHRGRLLAEEEVLVGVVEEVRVGAVGEGSCRSLEVACLVVGIVLQMGSCGGCRLVIRSHLSLVLVDYRC